MCVYGYMRARVRAQAGAHTRVMWVRGRKGKNIKKLKKYYI